MKKLLLLLGAFLFIAYFMGSGNKSTINNLTKLNSFFNSDLEPTNSTPKSPKKDDQFLNAPHTAPLLVPLPDQSHPSSNSTTSKPKTSPALNMTTQKATNNSTTSIPPVSAPLQPAADTSGCTTDVGDTCEPPGRGTDPPTCNTDPAAQTSDSLSTDCLHTDP
jgi:hypothetical protein